MHTPAHLLYIVVPDGQIVKYLLQFSSNLARKVHVPGRPVWGSERRKPLPIRNLLEFYCWFTPRKIFFPLARFFRQIGPREAPTSFTWSHKCLRGSRLTRPRRERNQPVSIVFRSIAAPVSMAIAGVDSAPIVFVKLTLE